MSDPAYVVQLGSGLYFDNEGHVHQGPVPPVPTYQMPGAFLTFLKASDKIAKTLNDIGDALPSAPDKPVEGKDHAKYQKELEGYAEALKTYDKFLSKLAKIGPSEDAAKILGVVGKIAGAIGNVFVVVGVLVAAANLLGLFNEGPSPLEQLVKARFDALEKQVRALAQLIVAHDLRTLRDALSTARSTVSEFVSQRDGLSMTDAQIESRLQTLITLLSVDSMAKILSLLDSTTYIIFFDPDEHTKVWPWITNNLFRLPADDPPQRASFPTVNSAVFDHRLAVPLASQAAQTFLAMAHSLKPEFRTTGDFRDHIRDCADKLAALALNIRTSTLALTIFTEADFEMAIDDFYVNDPFPGLIPPVLKPEYFLVVGAIDLCSHNDTFFADVGIGGRVSFPGPSKRGALDFRWHPPATLVRRNLPSHLFHQDGSPIIQYDITNPKECADAANQQAEQDYSDLLISSGYLTLVQLEAQMRHMATQSSPSETVRPDDVVAVRHPEAGSEVTVHSNVGPIVFTATGDIKAKAFRQPQKVQAFASCTTQAIPRVAPLINYRILLRTLSSAFLPRLWLEPHYEAVQSPAYGNDPLHPGFQRLFLQDGAAAIVDQKELLKGFSQDAARFFDDTVELTAHTFDWWVPVQPNPFAHDHVSTSGGTQSTGVKPSPRPPLKLFPTLALTVPVAHDTFRSDPASAFGLGWEDGNQTWQGQRREPAVVSITLQVKLEWKADRVHLSLKNLPEDRNYVVFLVVEETFGSVETDEHAPKILHTAIPIAINGQLTFVPQSLFDEEKAARDKQKAFADEFAISVEPEPGAPVIGTIQLGELATDAGVARLAATLNQSEPGLMKKLAKKQRPHCT